MTRKSIRLGIATLAVVLLAAPLAFGAMAVDKTNYGLITAAKTAYGDTPDNSDVVTVAGAIAGAVLALLGIIFLIQVIIAGISWMTAQGNDEKIATARNTIIHGAVGLVIVVAAYSLASYALDLAKKAAGIGQ